MIGAFGRSDRSLGTNPSTEIHSSWNARDSDTLSRDQTFRTLVDVGRHGMFMHVRLVTNEITAPQTLIACLPSIGRQDGVLAAA